MMRAVIARLPGARRADDRPRGLMEAGPQRWPEAAWPEAGGGPITGDIVEEFPSRCAKPKVAPAALARLLREAEARLALSPSPVGEALRARWPEALPASPILRPSPALPAYAVPTGRPAPNAIVALFGLDADGQRLAVARVLREQAAAASFVPVFLTNDPDFWPLRAAPRLRVLSLPG
jgi:hypothetical protein